MRFQFPDGQVVMLDQAFTREDFNYPADWLRKMTPEERAEWGLIEVPEPPAPVTPAPPSVPQEVSARQARLALLSAGLLGTVEALVAASTDPALKIEWEYATVLRRDNVSLVSMWEGLGRTKEELDALFVAAAAIP